MQNIETSAAERKYPGRDQAVIGDVADLPVGLDPQQSPIIAQHWFGISPAGVGVDTVATAA